MDMKIDITEEDFHLLMILFEEINGHKEERLRWLEDFIDIKKDPEKEVYVWWDKFFNRFNKLDTSRKI